MIGHPMDASGFTALAEYFRDRTVVTYDPRGTGRSEPTDRAQVRTPELHADDLHRLISALDAGAVDIFASSGGAINATRAGGAASGGRAYAWSRTNRRPRRCCRTTRRREAAIKDIRQTYEREGFGPAMAKFIVLTSLKGPIPADFAQLPAPNPADFGLPTSDDGSRDDPLLGAVVHPYHSLRTRLQSTASGPSPHRDRGRRRIRRHDGATCRASHRRAAQPGTCDFPQPPRRFPGR